MSGRGHCAAFDVERWPGIARGRERASNPGVRDRHDSRRPPRGVLFDDLPRAPSKPARHIVRRPPARDPRRRHLFRHDARSRDAIRVSRYIAAGRRHPRTVALNHEWPDRTGDRALRDRCIRSGAAKCVHVGSKRCAPCCRAPLVRGRAGPVRAPLQCPGSAAHRRRRLYRRHKRAGFPSVILLYRCRCSCSSRVPVAARLVAAVGDTPASARNIVGRWASRSNAETAERAEKKMGFSADSADSADSAFLLASSVEPRQDRGRTLASSSVADSARSLSRCGRGRRHTGTVADVRDHRAAVATLVAASLRRFPSAGRQHLGANRAAVLWIASL